MLGHTETLDSWVRLGRRAVAFVAALWLWIGVAEEARAALVAIDVDHRDTTIMRRLPDGNFVDARTIEISGGPGSLESASLFLPDLTPLDGREIVRATVTITKVENLSESCCDNAQSHPISVHRIASPWNPDQVTWRSQPDWGNARDRVTVSSADPSGTHYEFDITHLVQAWVAGDLPNFGFALAVDEFFSVPGQIFVAASGAPLHRARIEVLVTPEPGTMVLVGTGLFMLVRLRAQPNRFGPVWVT